LASHEIKTVTLIGAGKLANHLGNALKKHGFGIPQVYNRTPSQGQRLAKKLNATYTDDLNKLSFKSDLFIIAVTDRAIPEITGRLSLDGELVVHTSGTVAMSVLSKTTQRSGVLYPLQTFTGKGLVSFQKIPVCLEAAQENDLRLLADLAGKISEKIYFINSERRSYLHLAAVFAANFPHFLHTVAADLMKEHNLPLEMVRPLILQVARNTRYEDLFDLQTGPAVREDFPVIEQHRCLLSDHPEYQKIYDLITNSIIQYKKNHE